MFCGWQDESGNELLYSVSALNQGLSVDEYGQPVAVDLWPIWSPVSMPSVSKNFQSLTPGEMLFTAIAIQNGSATGCTITYYSDTGTYVIYETATNVSVTIALGDTKEWTLSDDSQVVTKVADFNHDYSDVAETHTLGITYILEHMSLINSMYWNEGNRHTYNVRFGDNTTYVGDFAAHPNEENSLYTKSYTPTASEITAGYADITAEGPTYLTQIKVTHSDQTTVTWEFERNGWYCGTDSATYSGVSWYVSDLNGDPDNPKYKIGKMLQSLGCDIIDATGNILVDGWPTQNRGRAYYINQSDTLTDFGGIKFDTTGTDTLNTYENNKFNGTGKSRIVFYGSKTAYENATEMSEGAVISIPVVQGDTITIVFNQNTGDCGGYKYSDLCKTLNSEETICKIPIGLRNIIVPAIKKYGWGGAGHAIQSAEFYLWTLSAREIGASINDERAPTFLVGQRYPIYTNDASRISEFRGGWLRDPDQNVVRSAWYFNQNNGKFGQTMVWSNMYTKVGCCSGEVVSAGGGE